MSDATKPDPTTTALDAVLDTSSAPDPSVLVVQPRTMKPDPLSDMRKYKAGHFSCEGGGPIEAAREAGRREALEEVAEHWSQHPAMAPEQSCLFSLWLHNLLMAARAKARGADGK
jgi:hypothetical protein